MAHVIKDRVKETSTSTGTGALTLAGAMTGYQAASAVMAVGDTAYMGVQAVDASGVPTGEWECGLYTYSGVNTLTRTTVTSSSNANAAVNFSAGTKQVFITMPAVQVAWARERLTAARTYYVATTGSDTNDGLTVGTPFLTVQKAIDVISSTLDLATYVVTIQLADGTYTGSMAAKTCLGGSVVIQGNSSALKSNVVISTTSANCFNAGGVFTTYSIKWMKLQTTTGGACISASNGSVLNIAGPIVFGASAAEHMYATSNATISTAGQAYEITGGATVHLHAAFGGYINGWSSAVTLTGTPAFSVAYAYQTMTGLIFASSQTFSGSATGTRYAQYGNSVIQNGGSTTFFPGNAAGSTNSGSQYY